MTICDALVCGFSCVYDVVAWVGAAASDPLNWLRSSSRVEPAATAALADLLQVLSRR